MNNNKIKWFDRNGTWEDINQNTIRQTNIKGACHRYTKVDFPSYQLKCTIKFLDKKDWGEAKILFTNANNNEDFRLDFMDIPNLKTCRLNILGNQRLYPIDVTKKEGIDINFILRTIKLDDEKKTLITLKTNEIVLFRNFLVPEKFNEYVGLGTYNAKIEFKDIILSKPKEKCFIVMPFNEKRDYMYNNAIKKALNENGVYVFDDRVYRLDESFRFGSIPKELQEKLYSADLIIADISEENLNVFYEIGYAYALNKLVLLLRDSKTNVKVPFDIRSDRYIEYDIPIFNQKELDNAMEKLKDNIINFMKDNII